MPYIEQTGNKKIQEQIWQWEQVMHDPNIDGFNGWGCKQKILKVLWAAEKALKDAPHYHGEEEWLEEQRFIRAQEILSGRKQFLTFLPQ